MLKFEGIHYNNQKWQLIANDGKVLLEGDYSSCRKKAFELYRTGETIKRINMLDKLGEAFDAVSGEDVMAEFDAIETAKKVQREQVMEEITLPAWGERYYNRLVKNVHAGKNTLFLDWHEKTDIEEETFLKQAKWLFADPGPGRLCTRALGILPDGTLKRIKIVQDRYGLTSYYEDKPLGPLWYKWNPLVTWFTIDR